MIEAWFGKQSEPLRLCEAKCAVSRSSCLSPISRGKCTVLHPDQYSLLEWMRSRGCLAEAEAHQQAEEVCMRDKSLGLEHSYTVRIDNLYWSASFAMHRLVALRRCIFPSLEQVALSLNRASPHRGTAAPLSP